MLMAFLVLSNIISTNIESSRMVMMCSLKIGRGDTVWSDKFKFLIVAIFCAIQFMVNMQIFESVYHLLETSTNTVEIIKNSLTTLILNQIDNHGSHFIFSIFKSRCHKTYTSCDFMKYDCDDFIEWPLLLINFIAVIYLIQSFVFE